MGSLFFLLFYVRKDLVINSNIDSTGLFTNGIITIIGSIISKINSNYDYYDKTNLIINAFVNSAGYQYIGRADLQDFIRGNF